MTSPVQLFTDTELADHLRHPVSAEAAASAERVVWGWLKPVLGLTERPDPVPDEVFSWAIELGGIAYENPGGRPLMKLGNLEVGPSADRAAEILATAAAARVVSPMGSFPDPLPFPDPARIRGFNNIRW